VNEKERKIIDAVITMWECDERVIVNNNVNTVTEFISNCFHFVLTQNRTILARYIIIKYAFTLLKKIRKHRLQNNSTSIKEV